MLFSFQVYSEAGLVITFIRNNTALPAFHHFFFLAKLNKKIFSLENIVTDSTSFWLILEINNFLTFLIVSN